MASDFRLGQSVYTAMSSGVASGVVEKVGRKWIHVRWTAPNGATWVKKMLPEWLSVGYECVISTL